MVKAIKVMLIPNNVQKTKMFQYAGASRFAYNWALAREKESYEKGGKFISDSDGNAAGICTCGIIVYRMW